MITHAAVTEKCIGVVQQSRAEGIEKEQFI